MVLAWLVLVSTVLVIGLERSCVPSQCGRCLTQPSRGTGGAICHHQDAKTGKINVSGRGFKMEDGPRLS